MARGRDDLAARLHGGASRRRRRSCSRDSREPLRRRTSASRSLPPHQPTAPEIRQEVPAPETEASPVDTSWFFEFPSTVPYSIDAAVANLVRWAGAYHIQQGSCPQILTVVERLVSLGVTSPGRLLGFSSEELANLFGQPLGHHQDIAADILHTTLARRLLALAWQCNTYYMASLQVSSSSASAPHADLAVEQMRVNAQLASALDKFAKGNKASKNPILRDHDSDDDDELDKFDLASALHKASFTFLPTDWFPSSQLLSKLQKLMSKAREARKHQGHPFIADTPLESWVPLWVGHGESPSSREALVKQWRKTESLDTSRFLSLVSNFWLAHAVVGVIQFPDVLAHLLLLIRMTAERSLSYAVRYERDLHYELQSLTRSSQKFSFSDLLHRPLRRLTHKLDIKHFHSKPGGAEPATIMTPPPKGPKTTRATHEGRDDRVATPARQPVCFKHDPGHGTTCSDGSCNLVHLDTKDPKLAERYAAALKAYKAKRPRAANRS